jgi:hypothetical protein
MARGPHLYARDQITPEGRRLASEGKLVEAGFASFIAIAVKPQGLSDIQRDWLRIAFMAGAQHLFSSILANLDPDEEATPEDIERLNLIADELDTFVEDVRLQAIAARKARGERPQ